MQLDRLFEWCCKGKNINRMTRGIVPSLNFLSRSILIDINTKPVIPSFLKRLKMVGIY